MTRQDDLNCSFAVTLSKMSTMMHVCCSPIGSPPTAPKSSTRRLMNKRHSAMPSKDQWCAMWSRIEDELRCRPPEPPMRQLSADQTVLRRHILRLAINACSSTLSPEGRHELMHGECNPCDFYRHLPTGSPARVASQQGADGRFEMKLLLLRTDGRAASSSLPVRAHELLKLEQWQPVDLRRIEAAPEPGVFVDPLGVMSSVWSQSSATSSSPQTAMPELL